MKKKLYMPFSKVDKQDDGTVIVIGIASSEAKDSQGEIIKASAMQAALPDFFKYGTGNLREMHQPLAAGTVDDATIKDGVTTIEVTVVDPVAVQKVLKGVYKGFSIGGSVTERDSLDKAVITGMRLSEISLVDRPANPDAIFEVFKADGLPEGDGIGDADPAPVIDATVKTEQLHEEVIADEVAAQTDPNEEPPKLEFVDSEKSDTATLEAVDQLAAILDKGDITPERLVEIASADIVNKGMYTVQRMSELLQAADYLAQDTKWEAEYEQDGSTVPARLRAWLLEGVAIFKDLVTEEVDELVAQGADSADDGGVVALADAPTDLAKFDASTVDDKTTVIIKGLGFIDGAPIGDVIVKMAERIVTLEAMPTIGKAFRSAVAISKAEDNGGTDLNKPVVTEVRKADGTVDDIATMIKAIHGGVA
jgi:hypothetical protein